MNVALTELFSETVWLVQDKQCLFVWFQKQFKCGLAPIHTARKAALENISISHISLCIFSRKGFQFSFKVSHQNTVLSLRNTFSCVFLTAVPWTLFLAPCISSLFLWMVIFEALILLSFFRITTIFGVLITFIIRQEGD